VGSEYSPDRVTGRR